MLFGDSYRTWNSQLEEYCRLYKKRPLRLEISKSSWIGYGGLKWCEEKEFQNELDEEGKGRKVEHIKFTEPTDKVLRKLRAIFNER